LLLDGHTVEFKSWSWFVYWDCVGKRLQLKYSPTWWKLVKPRRGRKARWYHTIRWEVQERLKKDTTPRGWRDRLPTHVRCGGNSWRNRVRDGVEDRGRWSCLTYGHDHPSTRHACGFHDAQGGDETFSSTDTIASTGFGGQCLNGKENRNKQLWKYGVDSEQTEVLPLRGCVEKLVQC
jgi:hypothetical protein